MEKEFMEYYKNALILHSALLKPPIIKGIVYKTGKLFRNLRKRFMVIDTNERALLRYCSEEKAPDSPLEVIALKDISSVKPLSSSKIFFQKGFNYFEVDFGKKLIFATKKRDIALQWINSIKTAVLFAKNYEKAIQKNIMKEEEAERVEEERADSLDIEIAEKIRATSFSMSRASITSMSVSKPKYRICLSSFNTLRRLGAGKFGTVFKVSSDLIY